MTALTWAGLVEIGKHAPGTAPNRRAGDRSRASPARHRGDRRGTPGCKVRQFQAQSLAIGNQTTNHLLNSSGSGRWQFWGAAVSEFRAHPLNGGGAGLLEGLVAAARLAAGALSEFAHSLYLEALGELGIVGLLLIGGGVLVAVAGAVRSARALQSGDVAAAAACGIAFFAAAAYDWVWQLAGIALVGVGMLGFALGALPSTRAAAAGVSVHFDPRSRS